MSNSNSPCRSIKTRNPNMERHLPKAKAAYRAAKESIEAYKVGCAITPELKQHIGAFMRESNVLLKYYSAYSKADVSVVIAKAFPVPAQRYMSWMVDGENGIAIPGVRDLERMMHVLNMVVASDLNIQKFDHIPIEMEDIEYELKKLRKKIPGEKCHVETVYDSIEMLMKTLSKHAPYNTLAAKDEYLMDAVTKRASMMAGLQEQVISILFPKAPLLFNHRFDEIISNGDQHQMITNAEAIAILELAEKHSQAMPH